MSTATVCLDSDLAEIARMNSWLGDRLVEAGDIGDLGSRIKLCLNEAAENAIRYGFDSVETDALRISLSVRPDCVEMELEDSGRPFNPLDVAEPEEFRDIESAQIGGLGIQLMRSSATDLHYERRAGRNVLKARFC